MAEISQGFYKISSNGVDMPTVVPQGTEAPGSGLIPIKYSEWKTLAQRTGSVPTPTGSANFGSQSIYDKALAGNPDYASYAPLIKAAEAGQPLPGSGMYSGVKTANNAMGLYSNPQEAANPMPNTPEAVAAAIKAGTAPGSAGAQLQQGLANGTVSPTDPLQQYQASLKGNNVNAPGMSAVSPVITPQQQAAALAAAKASGKAPQDSAGGSSGVSTALSSTTPAPTGPTTTPNVDAFFTNNPTLQQSVQQLTDFLSPTNTTKELTDALATIKTDQATVSGLKTQLMNINNVMSGQADDIAKEITAANGFATAGQVLALAAARNQVLQKQAVIISNQLQTAQDQVANDTTLFQNEKDMANTQFTQRLGIYNAAQTNYNNMQTAAKDAANNIIKNVGYSGYVNSLLNSDPTGATVAQNEKMLGLQPGQLTQIANQEKAANNLATIQASGATSPYVVTPAGEVWNTQTGYAYTSPQDFQQKTGQDLQTAIGKGAIQKLPANIEAQTKLAQMQKAQTDAKYADQMAQEDIAAKKASINASNASAGSSAASAAKSRYELGYEQSHGGLTPAEVAAQNKTDLEQGQKASDQAGNLIKDLGTKKIDWNTAWDIMNTEYGTKQPGDGGLTPEGIDMLLKAKTYRPH